MYNIDNINVQYTVLGSANVTRDYWYWYPGTGIAILYCTLEWYGNNTTTRVMQYTQAHVYIHA